MNYKTTIDENKINEIRGAVDIVDVISEYIPLTGKGKNFFGVCPFHDDHSPSMSVNRDRQIYKCFSCGAGGNVFTFVKDYENISFVEAVKKMADKAGIMLDLPAFKSKDNSRYKVYYDIYDIACKFYTNNINTTEGVEAKKYLSDRSLGPDIIKEFGIGLSLKNTTMLTNLLLKKGYSESDLIKIGLANSGDKLHDIYYNRIMFPLYDLTGKVVGFSGRIYNTNDTSKYINTKETDIFKKGELLYNYHRAKNVARQKDQIIVVEGFMDVIRLHTIGIDNVVATMGTAVTKEQLNLIKKMAKEIVLMLDGDTAGLKAAYHTSTELNNIGIKSKIVVLDDNLDPDEFIIKNGKDKLEYKLEHPINMMDFKLEYLKRDKDISSNTDRAEYVNEMLKELNQIDDEVLREITVKRLSDEMDLSVEFLKSKLNKVENKDVQIENVIKVNNNKVQNNKVNMYVKAEQNLLYYMLNNSEVVKLYNKYVTYMPTTKYRLLAKDIAYFYKDNGYVNEADIFTYLRNQQSEIDTLNEIVSLNLKEEYSKEEIMDYIKRIREYIIKDQINNLKEKQKIENDNEKKVQIGLNIIELKKQLEEEV